MDENSTPTPPPAPEPAEQVQVIGGRSIAETKARAKRDDAIAVFFYSLGRLADKATELLTAVVAQVAEEALERAEDKMRRAEQRARQAGR
jgi:hypothetical protein